MLTGHLTEAMTRAVAEQPFVPDYTKAVIRGRYLRRRRKRRGLTAGAFVVAIALAGGVTAGLWHDGSTGGIESLHPVGTTTPANPLLNGPTGPAGGQLYGRAYPVGFAIDTARQSATLIAFEGATGTGAALCFATWRSGSALETAETFQCVGPLPPARGTVVAFNPVTSGGTTTIDNKVTFITITTTDLVAALPRDTARAELIVAKTSDVPTRPHDGHVLNAQRSPVTLLGVDEGDMPALIGTAAPLPPDYIVVGFDAWNAEGQQTVHELSDSYCGKSPAGATRYPLALTNLRVSC